MFLDFEPMVAAECPWAKKASAKLGNGSNVIVDSWIQILLRLFLLVTDEGLRRSDHCLEEKEKRGK